MSSRTWSQSCCKSPLYCISWRQTDLGPCSVTARCRAGFTLRLLSLNDRDINFIPCFKLFGVLPSLSPASSPDVRQYLWKCVSHHPAAVLWDGPLPHPDAESQRVHPLPPDPQPAQAEAGGVLPARLVLHQRHRHERCEYRCSCTQILCV